jgi:hypothetical protein
MPTNIVPPPVKAQFFYNFNPTTNLQGVGQQVPAGFSETIWFPYATPQTAKPSAIALANARMAASAPDLSLVAIRITDTTVKRKPYLVDLNDPANAVVTEGSFTKSGQTSPQQSLHPELAMMLRVTTNDLSYGLRWFHCPPSAVYFSEEGILVTDVAWQPLFQAYKDKILGTEFVSTKAGEQPKVITQVQYVGLRSRRVGRPFGLFLGHRAAR